MSSGVPYHKQLQVNDPFWARGQHYHTLNLFLCRYFEGDGDISSGERLPLFVHLTQIKTSGMLLRLILAHDRCIHVRHWLHSIIGRPANGFVQ